MAHTLGMRVIAEGVEIEEQYEFLEKIGCEIMQGFLISKPVSSNEIERLLRKQ